MTKRLRTLGVWILGTTFLLACGCSRRPSRVHPPDIDAGAVGAAAMEQYDTNKDGKVAGSELPNAPSLHAAIDNLDTDKDGAITAAEVTKRIQDWQKTKLGLMMAHVTVTYRGQPLEGAKVVLEPEKFLGENVKPATGTANQYGMAAVSIEDAKASGLAAGLYKVKITKEGMNIPAKYNEQTILGAEVASDAKDVMEGGPTFDLR